MPAGSPSMRISSSCGSPVIRTRARRTSHARAAPAHLPPTQVPAHRLWSAIYEHGGIRTGEIGNAMFGRHVEGKEIPSDMDLVRIAIPRRAYTQSHIDYVVEVAEHVYKLRETLRGFRVIRQAPLLRHFTIEFEPI